MEVLSFMPFCRVQAKHSHCQFSCRMNTFISFYQARDDIVGHKRTGRVSFRGAEVSCPNIFFHDSCTKIKWFCPNITWFFARNGYLKNSRGGGGGAAAPLSPMGRTPMLLGAQKNDMNVCTRQENWQCERFACSQQKDVNDKTP